jgi:hypothetical protein
MTLRYNSEYIDINGNPLQEGFYRGENLLYIAYFRPAEDGWIGDFVHTSEYLTPESAHRYVPLPAAAGLIEQFNAKADFISERLSCRSLVQEPVIFDFKTGRRKTSSVKSSRWYKDIYKSPLQEGFYYLDNLFNIAYFYPEGRSWVIETPFKQDSLSRRQSRKYTPISRQKAEEWAEYFLQRADFIENKLAELITPPIEPDNSTDRPFFRIVR